MRLHDYVASAACAKVRLLLAQLGIEYERVPVDIFAGDTLTEDYARMNPARTTPVLEPEPGRFLPESNAILLYLAEGTPFLPEDRDERAQVHRWLFFEQSEVVPTIAALRFRLLTGRLRDGDEEVRHRRRAAAGAVAALERHLVENDFLVGGRYGVADVGLYGYVHVAHEAGVDVARYPAVEAWLERVAAQPGHVLDLRPYPANARPGAGRSIYDPPSVAR